MIRLAALTLAICVPLSALGADSVRYTAVFGGHNVGHVNVDIDGRKAKVDYNVKNNGRGPTMAETITFDANGLPVDWKISGTTTFGSKVDERFARSGARATWSDSTGPGKASPKDPTVYVAQSGSPWSNQIYVRARRTARIARRPCCRTWSCRKSSSRPAGRWRRT